MGAVNLEALEQLEAAEEAATGLQEHLDDLNKSRTSLLEAVRKIDAECRDRFISTFESIRTNFRDMFRRLFGGGKADLFLEEGQDVLDAGVEIVLITVTWEFAASYFAKKIGASDWGGTPLDWASGELDDFRSEKKGCREGFAIRVRS